MNVMAMHRKVMGIPNAMIGKSPLPNFLLAPKLGAEAVRVPPLINCITLSSVMP